MKIKIDTEGDLYIERAGKMKAAKCPLHPLRLGGVQCDFTDERSKSEPRNEMQRSKMYEQRRIP